MVEIPVPSSPLAPESLLLSLQRLTLVPLRLRFRRQPLLHTRKIPILRSRTSNGSIPSTERLGKLYPHTYSYPSSVSNVAQWQSWLRHSRDQVPSIEELLQDQERIQQTKILAKLADEKWINERGQQKLRVRSGEEVLKAIQEKGTGMKDEDKDPGEMKRNLPGQDPGSTFQPHEWSGKIGQR
jgi:hypothetical protein